MNERDQILLILVVACFAGTSFWPIAMGWVDVGTLAGWVELIASFGTCVLVVAVFAVGGILGFLLACTGRWSVRAVFNSRSPEREQLSTVLARIRRVSYLSLNTLWKLAWRVSFGAPRAQRPEQL